MRRAERRSVGGGDSDEALARPLAVKIGVNEYEEEQYIGNKTRYLDYL